MPAPEIAHLKGGTVNSPLTKKMRAKNSPVHREERPEDQEGTGLGKYHGGAVQTSGLGSWALSLLTVLEGQHHSMWPPPGVGLSRPASVTTKRSSGWNLPTVITPQPCYHLCPHHYLPHPVITPPPQH